MIHKIFAGILLFLIAASLWLEWRSPVLSSLIRGKPVEILILGLDEAEGTRRADTIILARLEPAPARVKVLQVPRDTLIRHGNSWRKINSLYERGGARAISEALNEFFVSASSSSYPAAPPRHHYLAVDYSAFSRIYEALGGVGGMDADGALGFVRSRGEEGDLGRLATQRDFYSMAAGQLGANPWRWLGLMNFRAWRSVIKSDLPAWEWAALAWRLRAWSPGSHFYYFPLPGEPDEKGNFKASASLWANSLPWWLDDGGKAALKVRPIRLELLNASGEPGLASRWTRLLRSLPDENVYDVLYFGNFSGEPRETSVLVTRQADLFLAKTTLVSLNNQTGLRLSHQVSPGVRQGVQFTLLLGLDAAKSPRLAKVGILQDF